MKREMMIVAELLNAEEELRKRGQHYWDKHPNDKAFLEQSCKNRRAILQSNYGIGPNEITRFAAARRKYQNAVSSSEGLDKTAGTIADIIIGQ